MDRPEMRQRQEPSAAVRAVQPFSPTWTASRPDDHGPDGPGQPLQHDAARTSEVGTQWAPCSFLPHPVSRVNPDDVSGRA